MITINNSGKNNLTEKMTEAKNAFIDQLAESYTEFNRTYSREIPTEFFDRCVEKYGIDFVLKTYDESVSNKITEFLSDVMFDVSKTDVENIFVLPGYTFTENNNRLLFEYTVTIIVPQRCTASFNKNVVNSKLASLYDAITYFTYDVLHYFSNMK